MNFRSTLRSISNNNEAKIVSYTFIVCLAGMNAVHATTYTPVFLIVNKQHLLICHTHKALTYVQ